MESVVVAARTGVLAKHSAPRSSFGKRTSLITGDIMLKNTLFCIVILTFSSFAQDSRFVHPLDFRDTRTERDQVIKYIVKNVRETYSAIGMDDPATLRMMEKNELDSFKTLTKAKNRPLLDTVIKTYCEAGMCSYSTILMMYNEQLKASQQSLEW